MKNVLHELFSALEKEGLKYIVSEKEESSTVVIEVENRKKLQIRVMPTDIERFVLIRISAEIKIHEHTDINGLLFNLNEWSQNSTFFKFVSDSGQICIYYEYLILDTDIDKELMEWLANMVTVADSLRNEFELECLKEWQILNGDDLATEEELKPSNKELDNHTLRKIQNSWEHILTNVVEEYKISDVSYNTWLKPLIPVSVQGNVLYVNCPDSLFMEFVRKKYCFVLQVRIADILGINVEIQLVVNNIINTEEKSEEEEDLGEEVIETIKENWERIISRLQEDQDISEISFKTWVKPLLPDRISGNQLYLNCIDDLRRSYVQRNYVFGLEYQIRDMLGINIKIQLCVEEN